jgi:hypothetical protein
LENDSVAVAATAAAATTTIAEAAAATAATATSLAAEAAATAATLAAAETAATATLAAAEAAATATTEIARCALFLRAGFVHGQLAAADFRAVERIGRCLGLFGGRHRNKRKTTGTSGELIEGDEHVRDRAMCGKRLAQLVLGRGKRKVTDIQLRTHDDYPPIYLYLTDCSRPSGFKSSPGPSARLTIHHIS